MRETALFGRDDVLRMLGGLLRGARAGTGGALVVRGPAGIGKTSVLAAVGAVAAADGMTVLSATGVPSEVNLPFAGLHQLLRPLLATAAELPGPQREALEAAFGIRESGAVNLFRTALATLELLVDAGQREPLLLVCDDGHWLDAPTTDVLAFLARRAGGEPIVLLLGVRDDLVNPFEAAGLGDVRLGPVDDDDALRILRAHAPTLSSADAAKVLRAAVGNPLALVELAGTPTVHGAVASPAEYLPLTDRLERSFAGRVLELPALTRTLLLVLAADGACSLSEAVDVVAAVHGGPVPVEVLEPAVAAQLVDADQLRFRHPLMASAVYQAASDSQRRAVHEALAQVVAGQPDRSVWHRAAAAAGEDLGIANDLEAVAERARLRGAVSVAVAALSRAAELCREPAHRAPLLLRAAELAAELGGRQVVEGLLERAGRYDLGPLEQGRLLVTRETIDPGGRPDAGRLRELVRGAETAHAAGDVELALNLLWAAASRCWWTSAPAEERAAVTRAAEAIGAAIGPLTEHLRLLTILVYVAPEVYGALVARVLAQARAAAVPLDPVESLLLGSMALIFTDYAAATDYLAGNARGFRAQGRLGPLARTLANAGWAALYVDRWDFARTAADEGAELAAEGRDLIWYAASTGVKAMYAALHGDTVHAEAQALEVLRVGPPAGATWQHGLTHQIRAVAASGAGRHDDAYQLLRRMFDPDDPAYHYFLRVSALAPLAEAALYSGNVADARGIVEALEPLAALTPAPYFHVGMRYARAVLADDGHAEARFVAAGAVDLRSWPMDHGRLLLAHGAWLRRQRRSVESRELLRAARDIFDRLGAHPWGERAREELRASGETSRARGDTIHEVLTPQELHIAQLVTAGLTNREIGEQLFLSHRTVSSHLYRIFPKLGILSRAQLPAALAARAAR